MRNGVTIPAQASAFLRFAALSGCGWLLDLAVLLLLVRGAGVGALPANLCSSALAASMVFLVSRRRIHDGAQGGVHLRLGLYMAYTACIILLASSAMPLLVGWAAAVLGEEQRTAAVFLAKVAVTPPQLLLNFFVSRALARHQWTRSDEHG